MENFMPLILDIVVVLIIFMYMKSSARKGFVRTVIQFSGYLASIVIANFVGKVGSAFIYDSHVRGNVIGFIENSLSEATNPEMILSELAEAISTLPLAVRGFFSSYEDSVSSIILNLDRLDPTEIATKLTDTFFAPILMGAVRIVIFIVAFTVLVFLVKWVSRMFTGVNYIPIIGPVNTLLGGAVGILEALLFIYVGAMIMNFVLMASNNGIPLLTREAINSTYLLQKFFNTQLLL